MIDIKMIYRGRSRKVSGAQNKKNLPKGRFKSYGYQKQKSKKYYFS
jgi:hypothetical protein